MVAAIVIVSAAFYWLGEESGWLSIRLPASESIDEYDRRILSAMLNESEIEKSEIKYTWKPAKNPPMSHADREYQRGQAELNSSHFSHSYIKEQEHNRMAKGWNYGE